MSVIGEAVVSGVVGKAAELAYEAYSAKKDLRLEEGKKLQLTEAGKAANDEQRAQLNEKYGMDSINENIVAIESRVAGLEQELEAVQQSQGLSQEIDNSREAANDEPGREVSGRDIA